MCASKESNVLVGISTNHRQELNSDRQFERMEKSLWKKPFEEMCLELRVGSEFGRGIKFARLWRLSSIQLLLSTFYFETITICYQPATPCYARFDDLPHAELRNA